MNGPRFHSDKEGKIVGLWDCGQVLPQDLPNADGAFSGAALAPGDSEHANERPPGSLDGFAGGFTEDRLEHRSHLAL